MIQQRFGPCLLVLIASAMHFTIIDGAHAQDTQPEPPQPLAGKSSEVAATVNGTSITVDQIQRDLTRTLKDVRLSPQQQQLAQRATLEKLIKQHVAFEYLKKHQIAIGDSEIQLRLAELKTELETVEKTLDDYLEQTNQTLAELEFQTAWSISWANYLERKLTDEFLEKHFIEHKRQFDGTTLRVSHLLLKIPDDATPEQVKAVESKANSIYEELSTTSRAFESFVQEFSDAPTKDNGGEIGWIGLDGPMPTSFTKAAYTLSTRECSKPIRTKFGVHLVFCLEVNEGELGWREVIEEVKKSAAQAYFDAIVKKHRSSVEIVYGKSFEPSTD